MNDDEIQEIAARINADIDLLASAVSGEDLESDAGILAAHGSVMEWLGLLHSRLTQAFGRYRWPTENEMDTAAGVLTRSWSSSSTHWHWDEVVPAYAAYVARTFDLPDDVARKVVDDMADTIGAGKSKAWKKTELDRREIYANRMRSKSGSTVRYALSQPDDFDDEEDDVAARR